MKKFGLFILMLIVIGLIPESDEARAKRLQAVEAKSAQLKAWNEARKQGNPKTYWLSDSKDFMCRPVSSLGKESPGYLLNMKGCKENRRDEHRVWIDCRESEWFEGMYKFFTAYDREMTPEENCWSTIYQMTGRGLARALETRAYHFDYFERQGAGDLPYNLRAYEDSLRNKAIVALKSNPSPAYYAAKKEFEKYMTRLERKFRSK